MFIKLASYAFVMLLFACSLFGQDGSAKEMRSRTNPIAVGETAPVFTLADETGRNFSLDKLKRPAVIVFYRGYW